MQDGEACDSCGERVATDARCERCGAAVCARCRDECRRCEQAAGEAAATADATRSRSEASGRISNEDDASAAVDATRTRSEASGSTSDEDDAAPATEATSASPSGEADEAAAARTSDEPEAPSSGEADEAAAARTSDEAEAPSDPRFERGRRQARAIAVSVIGAIVLLGVRSGTPLGVLAVQLVPFALLFLQLFRGRGWARWILIGLIALVGMSHGAAALGYAGGPDHPRVLSAALAVVFAWSAFVLARSEPLTRYLQAQRSKHP